MPWAGGRLLRELARPACGRLASASGPVFHTVLAANVLLVVPTGVDLYISDAVGLPDLLLFLLLSLGFTTPLARLTFYQARLPEAHTRAAAVAALLSEPPLPDTGSAAVRGPPAIALREVSFSHRNTYSAGSGKSSLAIVAARFEFPGFMALVFQDQFLFCGPSARTRAQAVQKPQRANFGLPRGASAALVKNR